MGWFLLIVMILGIYGFTAGYGGLGAICIIWGLLIFFTNYDWTKSQNNSNNNNSKTNNNTTGSISNRSTTSSTPVNKSPEMEVYVIVRFDGYPKIYTYLAPTNRYLKTGERVRVHTSKGFEYVEVIKGNHKCPKKTDMVYKHLDVW